MATVILWNRENNIFSKIDPILGHGMRVVLKPKNRVSITVWTKEKRQHKEIYFRGKAVFGLLEMAYEMYVNLVTS